MKYTLSLSDRKGLKRVCELLTKYVEIMEILNEDSKRSPKGGAYMSYEVEIKLKEGWS